MSERDLLIFDMDGVLIDTSDSYREATRETVHHFTGQPLSNETIQDYKMQVGWNDDWLLSHHLIQKAGLVVPYDEVVAYFQSIFRGENGYSGLIRNERWLPSDGLLARLAERFHLAIFTGRLQEEAQVSLQRFSPDTFAPVIGADNVRNGKPHPDGLFHIRSVVPHERVMYLGDTADDATSAQAANVPFIGVVANNAPDRDRSVASLTDLGASAIIEHIDHVEAAVDQLLCAVPS